MEPVETFFNDDKTQNNIKKEYCQNNVEKEDDYTEDEKGQQFLVEEQDGHDAEVKKLGTDPHFKREIVWKNAMGFLALHIAALYGLYLILTFKTKFFTFLWVIFLNITSGEGITMGAHRLFAHKAFKATFTLRFLLIILHTVAGQNCMYVWVRDHRQHHKFSDTDADPHNATRGFFFSHIGWLMSKKHPLVIKKGKTVDMSDMEADELVMWQKKYYKPLYFTVALILPVSIPIWAWNETFWNSLFTSFFLRYVLVLNQTWFVNSAAHLYGTKPFDKYILPSENHFVAFVTGGEGWHNYHHVFPWDYRTSEFGARYNMTCKFINMFNYFGMAYDLKSTPFKIIEQRSMRTGEKGFNLNGSKKIKTYKWGEQPEETKKEI